MLIVERCPPEGWLLTCLRPWDPIKRKCLYRSPGRRESGVRDPKYQARSGTLTGGVYIWDIVIDPATGTGRSAESRKTILMIQHLLPVRLDPCPPDIPDPRPVDEDSGGTGTGSFQLKPSCGVRVQTAICAWIERREAKGEMEIVKFVRFESQEHESSPVPVCGPHARRRPFSCIDPGNFVLGLPKTFSFTLSLRLSPTRTWSSLLCNGPRIRKSGSL